MSEKILILGGTAEAATKAAELAAQGHHVITSLAGRTREPKPVTGQIRTGGFGGVEGLADYLRNENIDRLIDMTHPFAITISRNAHRAASETGVPFERILRAPWKQRKGDQWQSMPDLETAARQIPSNARVLLALGSQHLSQFTHRDDVFFLIRMVDAPKNPLAFANHRLILSRPSANWREEEQLLKANTITHIVCRNSGGPGAYAKIEAARELQIPVIMIDRPDETA